jgi:hypothetical protein
MTFSSVNIIVQVVLSFLYFFFTKNSIPQSFSHSIFKLILLICMLSTSGFDSFQNNPAWGPPSDTLLAWGAINADKIMNCAELYRLFTAIWLNAGLFLFHQFLIFLLCFFFFFFCFCFFCFLFSIFDYFYLYLFIGFNLLQKRSFTFNNEYICNHSNWIIC